MKCNILSRFPPLLIREGCATIRMSKDCNQCIAKRYVSVAFVQRADSGSKTLPNDQVAIKWSCEPIAIFGTGWMNRSTTLRRRPDRPVAPLQIRRLAPLFYLRAFYRECPATTTSNPTNELGEHTTSHALGQDSWSAAWQADAAKWETRQQISVALKDRHLVR